VVTHTSDYFDLLAKMARDFAATGKAYMDDTDLEVMRAERGEMIDSKRRISSVDENLARFDEMLQGTAEGKRWCLRAKIDMKSVNGCMRDPVLFRCNDTPHHRTGTRYKAYPTYDFACPIIDSLEGVTHALRTSEYADRAEQFAWLQDAMELRKVRIQEYSRLNFVFTLLSKRKLAWFADNGHVEGWFDPRFPTVQGILRRGMTVPALREFILEQGASKRVCDMEWDKFWATNKQHIDPVAHRFTAIVGARARLALRAGDGVPAEPEARAVALHPKNASAGTKAAWFGPRLMLEAADASLLKVGEEITLMKWGNAIVSAISTGADGVLDVVADLHLAGDFKKTERKLTWIADGVAAAPGVPLRLDEFDFLITKRAWKIERDARGGFTC
jgi:glutamyl-tRNA synthetase